MISFSADQPIEVNLTATEEALRQIPSDPMGGWYCLPDNINQDELTRIKNAAKQVNSDSEYLVCIGIGGSYLGHRAMIEALDAQSPTKILYAGNNLSARELHRVLDTIEGKDFSVNVISKSGTTTEPAIAFRILKAKLRERYGEAARSRIYATTDARQGALHGEAVQEKYTTFVIPDNIGGRYSVLTAVGLLPMAVAGVDIDELLAGAKEEFLESTRLHLADLTAAKYANARANLFKRNYDVEVLASFEPGCHQFLEWWKQLFGESEGKNQQGIFPASAIYTTDLHSLGQYMQEGRRDIFETVLNFATLPEDDFILPEVSQDIDGLNYLAGRKLSEVNQQALRATIDAHRSGGIPVFEVVAPDLSARSFGALIYFYELSCALSAKLCGVNPFDQPGVEAYKQRMFQLLGKPVQ